METRDIVERLLKYIVMFLIIFLSCTYVPYNSLSTEEIIIISTIVVCTFVFIELYYPAVQVQINESDK
jgi:hypothetical protein